MSAIRLHLVELVTACQYLGRNSKRIEDKEAKLEFLPDEDAVLVTPYRSAVASMNKYRSRLFPTGAVFFMEPMSEEEAAEAEERDQKKLELQDAELRRQEELRQKAIVGVPAPAHDEIAALKAKLAELEAKKNAPKLTRAPAARTQAGQDVVKYVKTPDGKIVEVHADGSQEEAPPLPAAEEAAPEVLAVALPLSPSLEAAQAEIAKLRAQLKAQAVAEVVNPVQAIVGAEVPGDDAE